jgi:hypothetical protein
VISASLAKVPHTWLVPPARTAKFAQARASKHQAAILAAYRVTKARHGPQAHPLHTNCQHSFQQGEATHGPLSVCFGSKALPIA